MIRIRRGAVAAPASITGDDSAGVDERDEAIRHFTAVATRDESFKFAAYKGADVKANLHELFGEKCAYCEGTFRHTAPVDIEHFRPKGGVKYLAGEKLRKPGYYWLAADWDNLLPSCIDCNRARTQLLGAEETDPSEVRGKENQFPLSDPPALDRRLRHQNWDDREREENRDRLLIHPCRDKPEAHMRFHPDGRVEATSRKGRETIRVLGLERRGLRVARRAHALEIASRMQTCAVLVRAVAAAPDVFLQAELERVMLELETRTFEQAPFAALSRAMVSTLR